jgi:PilZ domain-containing protein
MYLYQTLKSLTTVVVHPGDVEAIPGNKRQAQACDISREGMKLLLAHKFERGTTLKIRTFNDRPEKLRSVTAEVRYAVPTCQGKWMMGCAFLKELSESELRSWVKEMRRPLEQNAGSELLTQNA